MAEGHIRFRKKTIMILTENKKAIGVSVNPYKVDYNSWPLDWLANYIEKRQRRSLTVISEAMKRKPGLINSMHRNCNSYLPQIMTLFNESIKRLFDHMKKEEAGLFPFIRELINAKELNKGVNRLAFVKVEALILRLNEDHNRENQRLKLITQRKKSYTSLDTHSKMHKALFITLRDFQEDLELHIYLQSKFLFPKIISMKYDAA